jgi:hypothetical protein
MRKAATFQAFDCEVACGRNSIYAGVLNLFFLREINELFVAFNYFIFPS